MINKIYLFVYFLFIQIDVLILLFVSPFIYLNYLFTCNVTTRPPGLYNPNIAKENKTYLYYIIDTYIH